MRAFITGGAGFIGSNLADELLRLGHTVTVYDNFSTGFREFVGVALKNSKFSLVTGDILNVEALRVAMPGHDIVFHLSANADVRMGTEHPSRDLEQNTHGTFNVLESMRETGIRRVVFASTGSVYGEAAVFPTPEDAPFPVQTSLYGASKLAGEGLVQAYCEGFDFQAWIFRFVSILGERYTHGHVFDFFRQLKDDPSRLKVLGNGKQKKSYLYIGDCISAILHALEAGKERVNIFNLGTNEYCQVTDSIGWITDELGCAPELAFTGGERGWIGDNPFIFLDTRKIVSSGWQPALTIEQAVRRTVRFLAENEWVFRKGDESG